ncbi:hypothetical protein BD289DRAFT_438934 [Coniella lustricola]|uniref:Secreted protein n=1 Tax=Coniella lustricola TaxID=2025994 RepID=A0A2T3A2A2_9PEZI|nr:hypothetical protein BD289DRAFT_438934 [Coniella lustricola]
MGWACRGPRFVLLGHTCRVLQFLLLFCAPVRGNARIPSPIAASDISVFQCRGRSLRSAFCPAERRERMEEANCCPATGSHRARDSQKTRNDLSCRQPQQHAAVVPRNKTQYPTLQVIG